MMGQWARAGATASLMALAGVGLGGCADNESSLFIRQVQVQEGDKCEVTASPSAPALFSGVLDAAQAVEYRAVVLVGNQLVRRGDNATLRTETSRIELFEADVSILDAGGASVTRSNGTSAAFTVPIAGFVDPGSGSEPGYGLASVLMIDAQTAQELGVQAQTTGTLGQVVAEVIIRGRTLGGNIIESAPWHFPISVCFGCLVSFPGEADDPSNSVADCDDKTSAPDANCRPGLDFATDCRICHPLNAADAWICQP